MNDTDHVVISVNPKAGARSALGRVERLVGLLSEKGLAVEVLTDLDEVAGRAARWHTEGRLRALVGVGGDGTAAELVNRTPPGLPLTMFPSGNENLLARYLRLGDTPEICCRAVAEGVAVRLDAGSANGRVFLLMASCGFDAEVVRRVHAARTGHIRSRHYLKPIFDCIRSYQYPEIRIQCSRHTPCADPERHTECADYTASWLFVFNLPCYGGGFRIAPQADGSDGLLDACAFARGGLWPGLRYVGSVLLGRHQQLADCTVRKVKKLQITSSGCVPYQLDGDPGGFLPLEIEVLPGRVTMLVPREGIAN